MKSFKEFLKESSGQDVVMDVLRQAGIQTSKPTREGDGYIFSTPPVKLSKAFAKLEKSGTVQPSGETGPGWDEYQYNGTYFIIVWNRPSIQFEPK